MSFPNGVIFGRDGDEKKVYDTKPCALGTRMYTPTGDQYRMAQCSSTTALAVGVLVSQETPMFADSALVATAGAGSTGITLTLGATAVVAKDDYEDGLLYIYKGAGLGRKYRIRSHLAQTASSAVTLNLFKSDPVKVAMVAATVMIRKNPFKHVILPGAATTEQGIIAGVTASSCAVGQYIWVQTKGESTPVVSGTATIIGSRVVKAATAGQVARWIAAADTTTNSDVIGYAEVLAAAADVGLVYLTLD